MKYRTTIEITSEAENKNEAIEIAGEYLSGNLASGIEMRYATRPVSVYKRKIAGVAVIFLFVGIAVLAAHIKPSNNSVPSFSGINAIQPPLKTSEEEKVNLEFKKEWQAAQTQEALDRIKR